MNDLLCFVCNKSVEFSEDNPGMFQVMYLHHEQNGDARIELHIKCLEQISSPEFVQQVLQNPWDTTKAYAK